MSDSLVPARPSASGTGPCCVRRSGRYQMGCARISDVGCEAQPSCRRPRKADDNARRNLSRRLDCVPLRIPFDNSYARLPARLFACIDPTPVAAPHLVRLNGSLAASLGIDPEELAGPEGVEVLAGNRIPEGA